MSSKHVWATIVIVVVIALSLWYVASRGTDSLGWLESMSPTTSSSTEPSSSGSTGGVLHGGGKPVVTTTGFASVSSTTAVVVGTVVPRGAETTYWFEYGTTMSYGSRVDARSAGAGAAVLGAAGYITGLKPATSYYFRIGAKNAYGTVYGSQYSFTTDSK